MLGGNAASVPATEFAPPSPPGRAPGRDRRHLHQPARPPPPSCAARPIRRRIALVAVDIARVRSSCCSRSRHGVGFGAYHIDLDVYRIGGRVLRAWRASTTAPGDPGRARLPFTYPPVAAVVFAPLALVPYPVAATALTVATVVSLHRRLAMFLSPVSGPLPVEPSGARPGCCRPRSSLRGRCADTLGFGGRRGADGAEVLRPTASRGPPRSPRGALRPAWPRPSSSRPRRFVLYFLLRRDYRAAGGGPSFAVATAAASRPPGPTRRTTRPARCFGRTPAGNRPPPATECPSSRPSARAPGWLDPRSPAGLVTWLDPGGARRRRRQPGMRQAPRRSGRLVLSLVRLQPPSHLPGLLVTPPLGVWFAPALLTHGPGPALPVAAGGRTVTVGARGLRGGAAIWVPARAPARAALGPLSDGGRKGSWSCCI